MTAAIVNRVVAQNLVIRRPPVVVTRVVAQSLIARHPPVIVTRVVAQMLIGPSSLLGVELPPPLLRLRARDDGPRLAYGRNMPTSEQQSLRQHGNTYR